MATRHENLERVQPHQNGITMPPSRKGSWIRRADALDAAELDAVALEKAARADERRKVLADVVALLRSTRTAGGETIQNARHAADVIERGDWVGARERIAGETT